MSFNKYQKAIISEIQSRDGIRWLELKKIIVDDKNVCSERIFRENLNELVNGEIIYKHELTPQHIEYYLQNKEIDVKKLFDEAFKRHYSQLEFLIQSIEKNKNKISIDDLAGLIYSVWRIINNLEFSFLLVSMINKKLKLLKQKDFKQHKIELLTLISKSNLEFEGLRLVDYLERFSRWETYQFADTIKKELTSKQIPWYNSSSKPS